MKNERIILMVTTATCLDAEFARRVTEVLRKLEKSIRGPRNSPYDFGYRAKWVSQLFFSEKTFSLSPVAAIERGRIYL
jgi:hypothetical protein